MDGLTPEALTLGGAVAVAVLAIILWKLFKLAVKVVVFIAVAAGIALVVAVYLKDAHPILPVPSSAPALPAPPPPR